MARRSSEILRAGIFPLTFWGNERMKALFTLLTGIVLVASSGCSVNVGVQKTEQLEEVVVAQENAQEGKILLIAIDGMISFETHRSNFFGKEPSMVASIGEQLDKARRDKEVKALILRINSPGGTLGATQMIHDELVQYRKETGAYVLGLYLEVAASGALYLSMASDHLMAYPSSVTGSMGVIYVSPNFQELGKKVGVEYRVVKTGAKKDMGSPFRSWPPEEQKMLENLAVGYNEQFKSVVFNKRKAHGMSAQDFEVLSDARIMSADQALKIKLIDEIGNINGAIANIEKKIGAGPMQVVAYTRYPDEVKNLYSRTYGVSASNPSLAMGAEGVLGTLLQTTSLEPVLQKGFYYLW